MSEIPYLFLPIPQEFLTDEFLKDTAMMKVIRYIMKRVRPTKHQQEFNNNRTKITIEMDAWHFIYGREKAALECGCSEKVIRSRIEKLRASSYLQEILLDSISSRHFSTVRASSSDQKKASSSDQKKASTFTVYRLVTESFKEIKGQQLNEEKGQQFLVKQGKKKGHKQEVQENLVLCLKETNKENPQPFVVPLPLSHRANENTEDLNAIDAYLESIDQPTPIPTIKRWLKNYGVDRLTRNIHYATQQKIKNSFGGYVETACKNDYDRQHQNTNINREFATKLKNTNNLKNLKINKKYCVDENGNDYQYNLDTKMFKEILTTRFSRENTDRDNEPHFRIP